MSKTALGGILLVVGVFGVIAVYSMRPPSGFGDALMMMGQGRNNFIKEPFYQILIATSGLIGVYGVIQIVRGLGAGKDKNS